MSFSNYTPRNLRHLIFIFLLTWSMEDGKIQFSAAIWTRKICLLPKIEFYCKWNTSCGLTLEPQMISKLWKVMRNKTKRIVFNWTEKLIVVVTLTFFYENNVQWYEWLNPLVTFVRYRGEKGHIAKGEKSIFARWHRWIDLWSVEGFVDRR